MLPGVEPNHLVTALFRCLGLGQQSPRIVASRLGGARAARSRPAEVFRQPNGHGPDTARKVRPGRRGDEQELDVLRWMHEQGHLGRVHERAEVEAVVGRRGHPFAVHLQQHVDRIQEGLLRQLRQGEPCGRSPEASGVGVRAEGGNPAVRLLECFQAFEHRLRVMEDRCARVHLQRCVAGQLKFAPAALLCPARPDHVLGEDPAEAGVGEKPLPLG